MNLGMDADRYERYQNALAAAEEKLRSAFHAFQLEHIENLMEKYDSGGQLADCKRSLASYLQDLQEIIRKSKQFLEQYNALQAEGASSLKQDAIDSVSTRDFWTLTGAGIGLSLSGYKSYQFHFNYGKTFSENYNDLYSFQQSKVFKRAAFLAGFGELTNYELWLGSDDFTDELLEDALKAMLQELPGTQKTDELDENTLKKLGESLGIENADEWFSEFKTIFNKYASSKKPVDDLLQDKNFQKLLDTMTGEEQEVFLELTQKQYELFDKISEGLGAASDTIDLLDDVAEAIVLGTSDFSAQIDYLDQLEASLLHAGFSSGPVLEQIDALRESYTEETIDSIQDVVETLGDDVIEDVKKEGWKAVKKAIPLLGNVDFGLTVIDTGAEIAFSDELEGYRMLSGFAQLDYSLTQAYADYEELLDYGIATEADMQEADKLYEMIYAVKVKEYDLMRSLCEGRDDELYETYNRKYNELVEFKDLNRLMQEKAEGVCRVDASPAGGLDALPNLGS